MSRTRALLDGVEAILFDFDGTLADSIPLILESYRYATRAVLGRPLPDEILTANLGRPLIEQMRILVPEQADELMRVYREHNLANHDRMIGVFPHVREVLDALAARGYALALVTSKGRELARRGLEATGLADLLATVVGLEDTEAHKPDPAPVLAALERLGVASERAAYVGDSPFDLAAGRSAGVWTVGTTWGPFSSLELERAEPDALIDDPRQLLELFGPAPAEGLPAPADTSAREACVCGRGSAHAKGNRGRRG